MQKDAKRSKKGRKVIPIGEAERVAAMRHMLGKSKREIARETKHSPHTVANIIKESDRELYMSKIRGGFIGLGDSANACLKREMDKGNWELAWRFLETIDDVEGREFVARVAGAGRYSDARRGVETNAFNRGTGSYLASLSGPDCRITRLR